MTSIGSSIAEGPSPAGKRPGTDSAHQAQSAPSERIFSRISKEGVPFLAVAAQFGLIVLIVHNFQIEGRLGPLLNICFAGFLLHHWLPARFRLPFFALLSVVATIFILSQDSLNALLGIDSGFCSGEHLATVGTQPGLALVGIGMVLIGLCHLPVPYWARVLLLVAVGAVLAVVRANAQWLPGVTAIWPILGSMFAFRIMLYLYDLKHAAAPFSFARACAYFFMVPNVCFPLFPIVDYKSFCSTYYNESTHRIYQVGIQWLFRGVVQLLLYRLVSRFIIIDIARVDTVLDAARFMVATYLLYLKVSGQFHLIVGLLHLFGFNLPETHHLYYLASSFTDFWRRINIYWKDFIMKLFFYPAFFRLRRIGMAPAIALGTLAAFFATWALHSWQWFWFLGEFLVSWQDISFWTILALLVLVNAVQEATHGRQRTLGKPRFNFWARLRLGLKTAGTFTAICLLWTIWSCNSWDELQLLAETLLTARSFDLVMIAAGLVAIVGASMAWGSSSRESAESSASAAALRGTFRFWNSAALNTLGAVCILALPMMATWPIPGVKKVVHAIERDRPNPRQATQQRRGYYEELDRVRPDIANLQAQDLKPHDWDDGRRQLIKDRSDFLGKEFPKSISVVLAGAPCTTNRWGMRDRDYQLEKTPGTYRIALLGSSHEMGQGVRDDETFENLVEERLVHEPFNRRYARYEILNLSVSAYGTVQKCLRLEQLGFEFAPDVVVLAMCAPEKSFVIEHLSSALRRGLEPPEEYKEFFTDIFTRAGVVGVSSDLIIQKRLKPFASEIVAWTLRRFKEQCERRGIKALLMYRPSAGDLNLSAEAPRLEILRLAANSGIPVIDMSSIFDDVADRSTLVVAPWDNHTNPLGHRMLAERFYEELARRIGEQGK
jgi:hypothetical protein